MTLIKLQDNVPEIYIKESRDFQLFCHLYDIIINGLKYDIDSITKILDTAYCRSHILPLLQLKLGFLTNKQFSDETLRKILITFIPIIRNKGTLQSIKDIAQLFLKINDLETTIKVDIINDTPTSEQKKLYGDISDHTIVLGLESNIHDISILYELLKFVSPIGYKFIYYFYSKTTATTVLSTRQKAKILYISNDINTPVMGSFPPTTAFEAGGTLEDLYEFTKNTQEGTSDYDTFTNGLRNYSETFLQHTIHSINNIEASPISMAEMNSLNIPSNSARPIVRDGIDEEVAETEKKDMRNTLEVTEISTEWTNDAYA